VLTGDAGVSSTDDSSSGTMNSASATAGATAADISTDLSYSYSAATLLAQPAYTVTESAAAAAAAAAAADAPVRDYSCLMSLMKSMSTTSTAAAATISAGSAVQSADGLALAVLAHMDRLSVAYCAVQSYSADTGDNSTSTAATAGTAATATATAGAPRPSATAAAAVTAVLKAHSGTAHQPDGLYCVDVCADTFEQLLSLLSSLQTCATAKFPRESSAQTHVAHALLACLRVLRANLVQLVSSESCMKDSVLSLCAANSAAHNLDTDLRNSSVSSSCNQADDKQPTLVGSSSSSDTTISATAAAAVGAADVHEAEAKRIASALSSLQQQLLHLLHKPPLDSTAAQIIQVCAKPYCALSLSDTYFQPYCLLIEITTHHLQYTVNATQLVYTYCC
jgi:hypothetical protein